MSSTINYGIDLGTTNSGIAKYEEGNVVIFKNPQTQKETIASVVAFKKDKYIIGEKARELITKDPENVVSHFKRKMGSDHKYYIKNQEKNISPIELSSMVLSEVKNFITTGEHPNSIVITIPAAFDTVQSNATKSAGLQAGFKEVMLLQEPIAASIAYANKSGFDISVGRWLAYDLGGGTFDVALVGVVHEELKVIDHEGDNYLGGTDFDLILLEKIVLPKLIAHCGEDTIEVIKNETKKWAKLKLILAYKCEELKKELTNNIEAELEIDLSEFDDTLDELIINVTRNEFDVTINPLIQKTIDLTRKLLLQNNIKNDDVTGILLVGGSTYVPAVKAALTQNFAIPLDLSVDPITAVMVGAAYYAGTKVSHYKEEPKIQKSDAENNFQLRTAYSKVSTSDEEILLISLSGDYANVNVKVKNLSGSYDTGYIKAQDRHKFLLPLIANSLNIFELQFYSFNGELLQNSGEKIEINHGKFGISGQPLPQDICIEIDSPQDGKTYLEAIFKKNDILPLNKTITKQLAATVLKNSSDSFSINVMEGSYDDIPAAAKSIGKLRINGQQLERDIVKGSDIELTFKMSESRDLKVLVYVKMTDQDFENVFSPTETSVDIDDLKTDLKDIGKELRQKINEAERDEEYNIAQATNLLFKECETMLSQLENISNADTDQKYKIDIAKRTLISKAGSILKESLHTKLLRDWYEKKAEAINFFSTNEYVNENDREIFNRVLESESSFINAGSVKIIKSKIKQIDDLKEKISSRRKISDQEIILYYNHFKTVEYKDTLSAEKLIQEGDKGIDNQNIYLVTSAVNGLYTLYLKENPEDGSPDYKLKTGLK